MRLEEGIKRSQANKLYLSWRNLILLLSNDALTYTHAGSGRYGPKHDIAISLGCFELHKIYLGIWKLL